jgi:hypothetical protein
MHAILAIPKLNLIQLNDGATGICVRAQVVQTYAFTANNSGTGATESLTTS